MGGKRTACHMQRHMLSPALIFATVNAAIAFNPQPNLSPKRLAWLQEAEKKHTRVALLALPSLATIALTTGEDPVRWLNTQSALDQLVFYSVAGILESFNLRRLDKGFTLKEGESPGRLLPGDTPALDAIENGAGRIAMLIVTAVMTASIAGGS